MTVVTIADAAKDLAVSEDTVRRFIANGDLPAYRLGRRGHIRIRAEDVAAVLRRMPTSDGSSAA
jgi:excisionase family DNA binding protein